MIGLGAPRGRGPRILPRHPHLHAPLKMLLLNLRGRRGADRDGARHTMGVRERGTVGRGRRGGSSRAVGVSARFQGSSPPALSRSLLEPLAGRGSPRNEKSPHKKGRARRVRAIGETSPNRPRTFFLGFPRARSRYCLGSVVARLLSTRDRVCVCVCLRVFA
jgi:hypothetical protein